jgi:hypothetical protein
MNNLSRSRVAKKKEQHVRLIRLAAAPSGL